MNTSPIERIIKETKNAYFDLPKLTGDLKTYVHNHDQWSPRVQQFTNDWLNRGLLARAITRDLEWGIKSPFPDLENKSIYVWAEAVLGYCSTIAMRGKLKEFWFI